MALAPGTRLGSYEIVSAIGAGGMGEVYRARDTKLNRDVAIKILPDSFASDTDRVARFTREAHTLASLNHTNIAQIYGFEDRALVMELVEGEDLSARIAHGAIPLDEAMPIARQIAEALEAAHDAGIIHRDLKPANIKVRPDGAVKVLDFGLAKALDHGPGIRDQGPGNAIVTSPTIASPAVTQAGIILGTAAYMAPEQARGKAVDKRADIWAFGVVLYEMLTGRTAFTGDTITDIVAAIVTREPDWHALPVTTPASITHLLMRCLAKDSKQRLRDIGEVRLALEAMAHGSSMERGAEVVASRPRVAGYPKGVWALAGGALVGIVIGVASLTGVWPRTNATAVRPLRVSIIHTDGSEVGTPAISPDGQRVAYRARGADGMPMLWVRDLATGEARALPGTEDAALPFWSPDSRDLGFFTLVTLKRVSAAGGPVRVLVKKVGMWSGYGGTWGTDGTILFTGQHELLRVSAEGGPVTPVTKLPSADWGHFWPSFLPDGRRFLFTAKLWTSTAETSEQGVYLGSIDSPTIQRLLPDLSSAVYAPPGFLVFARDGALMAVKFDPAAGRVTGTPQPIGTAVAIDQQFYLASISAATDGTIALRPPPAVALLNADPNALDAELHFFDRNGTSKRVGSARPFSYFMALNPRDTNSLVAALLDPRAATQDLWLVNLTNDTISPLTSTRGFAGVPVWSNDGKRLAFSIQPAGGLDDLVIRDLGTGRTETIIETQNRLEHPSGWSHDGKSLLVYDADDREAYLSWWSFESRKLTRLVGPGIVESAAAFSPKDDLVAYTSDESGRPEVYVTTFPDRRQNWPITTDGGRMMSWSRDGREILVATLSGHVAAYPVSTANGFSRGEPTTIMRDVGYTATGSTVTADHSRVLLRIRPDAAKDQGEIRLLFGWQQALQADR